MTTVFTCPHCSSTDPIPMSSDRCPSCGEALQAPNVRAAGLAAEKVALDKRLAEAEDAASARSCIDVLNDFGNAVGQSEMAICRPIGRIKELVDSSNHLYTTFYNQMSSQQRLPEENGIDDLRGAVDAKMFPNYPQHIVFGALTLNGVGATGYGGHTMVLKEEMIERRASVFETNTVSFVKKHNIGLSDPILPGYRAQWQDRGKLAKAKLHYKLESNTRPSEYANILLENDNASTEADFVEVHVYRGFNKSAIKKVVFETKGLSKVDDFLIRALKVKLEASKIEHEER